MVSVVANKNMILVNFAICLQVFELTHLIISLAPEPLVEGEPGLPRLGCRRTQVLDFQHLEIRTS